jgi:hypothetical protein
MNLLTTGTTPLEYEVHFGQLRNLVTFQNSQGFVKKQYKGRVVEMVRTSTTAISDLADTILVGFFLFFNLLQRQATITVHGEINLKNPRKIQYSLLIIPKF